MTIVTLDAPVVNTGTPDYLSALNSIIRPDECVMFTLYCLHEWAPAAGCNALVILAYLKVHGEDEPVRLDALAKGTGLSNNTIRREIKRNVLLKAAMDFCESVPWEDACRILKQKSPQSFAYPIPHLKKCEWCRSKTLGLHAHHYPTPKAEGGTETVNICPNCHTEFHALTRNGFVLCLNRKGHSLFMEVAK